MKDLRIVIPAYNEESGIADIIDRVKKSCPESELVVVDDCSTDRTGMIARDRGATVIKNPSNINYGGALKTGFHYKSSVNAGVNYFAFLDADGTYPPESIPMLYELCAKKGYDIVVGSRLSSKNTGMPWIRRTGNRLFAWLASFYTNRKISDTASGLRVFNIKAVPWVNNLPNGLNFTPAMTVKAIFEGLSYTEIPIEYSKREGRSKLSAVKDGYRFLKVIMDATRIYRPKLFFCTLGIPYLAADKIIGCFFGMSKKST